MKITLIVFWSMLAVALAHSAPLTVAVYDFKGESGAASYGKSVTTLITADLTTETNLVMLERAELNKALSEQAFGLSGMVNSDAAAKIGQITGAKVLVAGQVIKTGSDHLVIVANVIGTETGRLFADKVEGGAENLMDLTSDLSRKITATITDQATNLVTAPEESHAARLARIIKGINGTNRPTVSVSIILYNNGKRGHQPVAEGEWGMVLLKAGFTVVDDNSDRKPDVEIIGGGNVTARFHKGGLFSSSYKLDVKVQERRSGNIITIDHQESSASGAGYSASATEAQIKAVDALAERILPLLAK